MNRSLDVARTSARCLSTRGPRGPRSIVDKSRTISRNLPRATPKAASHARQNNGAQSSNTQSQQDEVHRQSQYQHIQQQTQFQEVQQPAQQDSRSPLNKEQQQDAQQNSVSAQKDAQPSQASEPVSRVELVSTALAENSESDLIAPVNIPEDADGVLDKSHPAMSLLNNSSLVIQRQIEMMNVFLGFEQANRYVIMNGRGETIGYLAERDHGVGSALVRNALRTHRSFTAHIFDADQREVLRIHRPFSWISSRIRIYDPINGDSTAAATAATSPVTSLDPAAATSHVSELPLSEMRIIGEAQQQWAPLRRKYNLFNYRTISPPNHAPDVPKLTSGDLINTEFKAVTIAKQPEEAIEAGMAQFAYVNEPFLSWDFTLKDSDDRVRGSVNRNFAGFAREIFTDTGVYALRMDSASLAQEPSHLISHTGAQESQTQIAMTLDQRAVMLATAVSIDFDYFSRHSGAAGGGFGFFPMWFPGMGGGAAEGGAAGGAVGGAAGAGEVGAAEGADVLGGASRGAGVGEGAVAGAGTMAGYEAMQRGRDEQQNQDDASPTATNDPYDQSPQQSGDQSPWGEQADWGNQPPPDQNDPWAQSGGGESGGGGDGGGGFDWGDWF